MSTRNSAVCVIGAGPAGLCAVKHCLDFGLSVHCYERRSRPGGRWAEPEMVGGEGEPWNNVSGDPQLLLSSQFVNTFSDFPLPDDLTPSLFDRGRFLDSAAFFEYLDRYATAFALRPYIVCRMEVVDTERMNEVDEDGFRWIVRVRTRAGERSSKHKFVIVATGSLGKPRLPEIALPDGSKVMHSSQFRGQDCAGRSVLVVGGSCSGVSAVENALRGGARNVTWTASQQGAPWPHIWLLDRCPVVGLAWDEWPLRLLRLVPRRFLSRLLTPAAVPVFQRDPNLLQPLDLTRDRLLVANAAVITAGLATDRLRICSAAPDAPDPELCVLATGFEPPQPFPRDAPPPDLYRGVLAADPPSWGLAFLRGGLPLVELQARWVAHQWSRGRFHTVPDRSGLIGEPSGQGSNVLDRALLEAAQMELLAADIGCAPSPWRLLLSPWPSCRRAGRSPRCWQVRGYRSSFVSPPRSPPERSLE